MDRDRSRKPASRNC